MNAYNQRAAMRRLVKARLAHRPAEAIAADTDGGHANLPIRDELDAALAKQTVRIGVLTSGIVAVATSILGVLISLK